MYSLVKESNRKKKKNYPSLYDMFELGDRVKRKYKEESGKYIEYKGIVLAIDNNRVEICWDLIDGKYRSKERDIAFTNCHIKEIFSGTDRYSSIKKDKDYN